MWGMPYGMPPPNVYNYYPPNGTAPNNPVPPPPAPSKAEIKEYMAFAKAWAKKGEDKKKDKKEDKKKNLIKDPNYSMVEVFLFLLVAGPFVGPVFNLIQEKLLHALH